MDTFPASLLRLLDPAAERRSSSSGFAYNDLAFATRVERL